VRCRIEGFNLIISGLRIVFIYRREALHFVHGAAQQSGAFVCGMMLRDCAENPLHLGATLIISQLRDFVHRDFECSA
jgi:hypothetical protein